MNLPMLLLLDEKKISREKNQLNVKMKNEEQEKTLKSYSYESRNTLDGILEVELGSRIQKNKKYFR